jgi:iron complex transport system substrate-binding protein
MHRIVSLIASATEIVCALGFEKQLVGRSHECDFPPAIKELPVCTAPRIDVEGTSSDIDRRIKEVVQDGLSVYRVHTDVLRGLQPSLLITQTQCEVCAVSLRDVEQALGDWLDSRPRIVALAPNTLADVWNDVRRVAEALGVPQRGNELGGRLQERVDLIAHQARGRKERPTVACIEWLDPLMAAGNWVPELVELAGGVNLFGEPGKHAPWMTWEQLCVADPDVLVFLPCGFDITRTRRDLPVLSQRSEWPHLRAVQNGRAFLMDGNQYFNRPGPRLAESLEILTEVLHPDAFAFGHCGTGWQPA